MRALVRHRIKEIVSSVMDMMQLMVIPAAFALDVIVGDPRALPHPIRWMGRSIELCEPVFRRWVRSELMAGCLFALVLILGCWGLTTVMTHFVHRLHPGAGIVLDVVLIFYCLSARSLYGAAMEIYHLLNDGRVDGAKAKLAMIVGRDVAHYGADDISRATVETVAENFVDGVLSPLFYAAIGGAPMAMAYKMVNTLDSMVGYKNERYRRFGRAAARIDDVANFIPARLSVAIISLAARLMNASRGGQALRTGIRQGSRHSSPNAGYAEAAFAGALSVKLNGPNYYGGVLVSKPYIGTEFGAVEVVHIEKSCQLMLLCALMSTAIAWLVSIGTGVG